MDAPVRTALASPVGLHSPPACGVDGAAARRGACPGLAPRRQRKHAFRGISVAALLLTTLAGCYEGARPSSEGETDPTTGAAGSTDVTGRTGGDSTDGSTDSDDDVPAAQQRLHRLNRLEYDNTVRDLLGTSIRPASLFGPDPEANGFDNQAEQLQISSALIDAYDLAARTVIDDVLDAAPIFSETFRDDALAVPGGYAVGSLWALNGQPLAVEVTVPEAMDLELVLTAGASVVGSAPAPEAFFRIDGSDRPVFAVEGTAATRHSRIDPLVLDAGTHTIELVPTNHINEAAANISNNVFVESLEVRSVEVGASSSRGMVYVCEPSGDQDEACYETIVSTFASRAWRRPVRDDELLSLMGLWDDVRDDGEPADQALRLVLRAVMLSPKFFARMRTDRDDDDDEWLDDYVLASRLSYFLWSSMPDDRLFAMAQDGRLSTSEGLSEAVAFMLDDPKAEALVDGFAEQWLSTRRLASFVPSPDVYPSFDDTLRDAMVAESRAFFGEFLSNGTPLSALLQPEFAFRNDRLASHYGLPPVGATEMVRVPAGPGDRRGLLSLGAWLTATSGADHSSPIRRGQWIADRVMCASPPPPPPGLEFEPPELGGDDDVRDALERHRDDPGCASCHALLDVIGIGLEEYDGVAAPRQDAEVDNLGELPDGSEFEGGDELAQIYADRIEFSTCVAEKLFTYAVGRAIAPEFDGLELEAVVMDAAENDHDLRQLIDGIVHTASFRSPSPL